MELTYPEVAATRDAKAMPAGYFRIRRRMLIGTGHGAFTAAVAALRDWRMFRVAGLAIRTRAGQVAVGVEFDNGLGVGPLRLWAPCRIVWLVDLPRRFGYGMGTLPGHPATGEEAFEVTVDDRDDVWAEVRAFSRPARWYTRLGGPVTRALQRWITGRYLRALRRLAHSPGWLGRW